MKRMIIFCVSVVIFTVLIIFSTMRVQAQGALPDIDWGNAVIVSKDEVAGFPDVHRFEDIGSAMSSARIQDGSEIVVFPGTYEEQFLSNLRTIVLRSFAGPDKTIITAQAGSSYVFGDLRSTSIVGFTITNTGAINQSSANSFQNCVFINNGTLELGSSNRQANYPVFRNNVFVNNGKPVFALTPDSSYFEINDSTATATNVYFNNIIIEGNIFYGNTVPPIQITGEFKKTERDIDGNQVELVAENFVFHEDDEIRIQHNNFFDNTDGPLAASIPGNIVFPPGTGINEDLSFTESSGNLNVDPQFLNAQGGDYRLLSSSPVRNNGIPGPQFLDPDGSVNDMGAFGGPFSVTFFQSAPGAPVIRSLQVTPGSVLQGESFTIQAVGALN